MSCKWPGICQSVVFFLFSECSSLSVCLCQPSFNFLLSFFKMSFFLSFCLSMVPTSFLVYCLWFLFSLFLSLSLSLCVCVCVCVCVCACVCVCPSVCLPVPLCKAQIFGNIFQIYILSDIYSVSRRQN